MLAASLQVEGIEALYEPPIETRSIEQQVVHVVMHLLTTDGDALFGAGTLAVIQRVVKKFKKDHPGSRVEVEEDEVE